jgi:hypothetical protein
MYFFLQKFHSGWAYLALILLVFAVANAFFGLNGKRIFTSKDRKIALFALIATHIQLLVGLVLYFLSPIGLAALSQMANATLRLTAVEHPFTNIIAVVLITIGWSKHKKATEDSKKFKSIRNFYALGLGLILLRIPWHLWF